MKSSSFPVLNAPDILSFTKQVYVAQTKWVHSKTLSARKTGVTALLKISHRKKASQWLFQLRKQLHNLTADSMLDFVYKYLFSYGGKQEPMWSGEQTVVQSEWWVIAGDIYMFVWLKYHNVALVHLACLSLAESMHFNLHKIWQVNLIGLMPLCFHKLIRLSALQK